MTNDGFIEDVSPNRDGAPAFAAAITPTVTATAEIALLNLASTGAGWQLYLSRPEQAYALANERILSEAEQAKHACSGELG